MAATPCFLNIVGSSPRRCKNAYNHEAKQLEKLVGATRHSELALVACRLYIATSRDVVYYSFPALWLLIRVFAASFAVLIADVRLTRMAVVHAPSSLQIAR